MSVGGVGGSRSSGFDIVPAPSSGEASAPASSAETAPVAGAAPRGTAAAAFPEARAYDHIATLLDRAGGADPVIARSEAGRAAAGLREQGRGTEALALARVFEMLDAADGARDGRVSREQLDRARPLVRGWLVDAGGAPTPVGRSLAELGRVLAVPQPSGRIAHAVPDRGLRHVADLLRASAGSNGVVSAAEATALATRLKAEGRGNEALAVEQLYAFARSRLPERARLDGAALDSTVRQVTQDLRAKDTNRNGYSASEVAAFSPLARALLEVGRTLPASGPAPVLPPPAPAPPPRPFEPFTALGDPAVRNGFEPAYLGDEGWLEGASEPQILGAMAKVEGLLDASVAAGAGGDLRLSSDVGGYEWSRAFTSTYRRINRSTVDAFLADAWRPTSLTAREVLDSEAAGRIRTDLDALVDAAGRPPAEREELKRRVRAEIDHIASSTARVRFVDRDSALACVELALEALRSRVQAGL